MSGGLHHEFAETVLLGVLVLACWVGVVGMWRMREPTQAMHYLSLPATLGVGILVAAVFLEDGSNQIAWKTLLTGFLLLAVNSVGSHAAARAFRARQLGHWEPREGDPLEFVRDDAAAREEER